jgi:hypothetical protein
MHFFQPALVRAAIAHVFCFFDVDWPQSTIICP